MATLDLRGSGLGSSGRVQTPTRRRITGGGMPATAWPAVTVASVADAVVAALGPALWALDQTVAAVPQAVHAVPVLNEPQQPGSAGAALRETAARVAAGL